MLPRDCTHYLKVFMTKLAYIVDRNNFGKVRFYGLVTLNLDKKVALVFYNTGIINRHILRLHFGGHLANTRQITYE